MKQIYFIRHAKSDWSNPQLNDHERPLNKRGMKDAPLMAEIMQKSGISPDAIFSSTAKRAFTTAEIFFRYFPKAHLVAVPELYHANEITLQDFITYTDNKYNTIFIIAHNPGLNFFCSFYPEFSLPNIPTTGVIGIEADIDNWTDFNIKKSRIILVDYP